MLYMPLCRAMPGVIVVAFVHDLFANGNRGFCIQFATCISVLLASYGGFPVSTTHCQVIIYIDISLVIILMIPLFSTVIVKVIIITNFLNGCYIGWSCYISRVLL